MINIGYYYSFLLYGFAYYLASEMFFKTEYRLRKQVWELVGSTFLLKDVLATFIMYPNLYRATDWMVTCHPIDHHLKTLVSKHAAWYLYRHWYQILGGDKDYNTLEITNSFITLFALIVAHENNMEPVWLLTFLFMSIGTPLLHLSKALHCVDRGHPAKRYLFTVYVLMFVGMNIVLFPQIVLRQTLSAHDIMNTPIDIYFYWLTNGILFMLYLVQVVKLKNVVYRLLRM